MLWQRQADQVNTYTYYSMCMHMFEFNVHHIYSPAVPKPSYGELIDLFEETKHGGEEFLCSKFRNLYPEIYIGRPRRFYETVQRIAAPTKASLRGESKLQGSQLASYRKRSWEPRIRNQPKTGKSYVTHRCVHTCCMYFLHCDINYGYLHSW